jgi:hypothetical protein
MPRCAIVIGADRKATCDLSVIRIRENAPSAVGNCSVTVSVISYVARVVSCSAGQEPAVTWILAEHACRTGGIYCLPGKSKTPNGQTLNVWGSRGNRSFSVCRSLYILGLILGLIRRIKVVSPHDFEISLGLLDIHIGPLLESSTARSAPFAGPVSGDAALPGAMAEVRTETTTVLK